MTTLADIQRRVGVTADGKWGPNTADAIWKALGPSPSTKLTNPSRFFDIVRAKLFQGEISQSQVNGINMKLGAMGAASWPIAYAAYGLATSYWETARAMQPVRESGYLGEPAGERHRKTLRYYPWYGRGDVQTTWEQNYRRADAELGLGGSLIANPDRMLEPKISADTMVLGMAEGWFTGKSLSDFLPSTGLATRPEFREARRIINGTDKADEVAGFAIVFQSALVEGGWS